MAVIIPDPITHEDVAKNQHMIPRCYMKAWAYNPKKTSVWVYDKKNYSKSFFKKSDWKIESKPTQKINAIDNFHDLKAGFMYLPQEALDEIFKPLLSIINVIFEGNLLDTEEKLWKNYHQFDKWAISDKSACLLTQDEIDALKKYLEESRYTFVETEWAHTYENDWNNFIQSFEGKVRRNDADKRSGRSIADPVSKNEIEKLMRYAVIYNFRSISGSGEFNKILDDIEIYQFLKIITIPEKERIHPEDKTAAEEFKHAKRVKDFLDFLKTDSGTIKTFLTAYIKNLDPYIWITDVNTPFITSNEPSFTYCREDKLKEMLFVASPTMLVSFAKGKGNKFYVENASEEKVKEYNAIVARQASMLIVDNQDYNIQDLLKESFGSRLIYTIKSLFIRSRE